MNNLLNNNMNRIEELENSWENLGSPR